MKKDSQFNKALRLLDLGKVDKVIQILRDLLIESQEEQNNLYFIRASCVLGEIYFEIDFFDEAKTYLTNVINTNYSGDLVNFEKNIAKDLLQKIEAK